LWARSGIFQRSASREIKSDALWIPRNALFFFAAKFISSFKALKLKYLEFHKTNIFTTLIFHCCCFIVLVHFFYILVIWFILTKLKLPMSLKMDDTRLSSLRDDAGCLWINKKLTKNNLCIDDGEPKHWIKLTLEVLQRKGNLSEWWADSRSGNRWFELGDCPRQPQSPNRQS
jgi:hypothetical protein